MTARGSDVPTRWVGFGRSLRRDDAVVLDFSERGTGTGVLAVVTGVVGCCAGRVRNRFLKNFNIDCPFSIAPTGGISFPVIKDTKACDDLC